MKFQPLDSKLEFPNFFVLKFLIGILRQTIKLNLFIFMHFHQANHFYSYLKHESRPRFNDNQE